MTANMIYIVALGVGLKCPRKIHLNTQWGGRPPPATSLIYGRRANARVADSQVSRAIKSAA